MNTLRSTVLICAAALLLAACSDGEAPDSGGVVCPVLNIGVAEMEFSADTRASEPMSPDAEKYVTTAAIFEFDNEGLHTNDPTTYHFIDFLRGTVDGVAGVGEIDPTDYGIVDTSLKGLRFRSYSNGTICMVANITEEQVADFYENYREPGQSSGRITFDQFKKWALPFEYEAVNTNSEEYDDRKAGHLKVMYMFGYYQGPIDSSKPQDIFINLGRLASRLDVTVVNNTGREIDKRLGYHFDNVCRSAYFFPMKTSIPPDPGAGLSRTLICSGKNDPVVGIAEGVYVPETFPDGAVHTHYFYVAAHSAVGENEATKLHLFYNTPIVDDNYSDPDAQSYYVPLCNVHPSQAAEVPNGYSLSRNTRYSFTIRLVSANTQTASQTAGSPAAGSQSVGSSAVGSSAVGSSVAGSSAAGSLRSELTRPGEITVYLPIDD